MKSLGRSPALIFRLALGVLLLSVITGCSSGRGVTITADPPDALISVDGTPRGRGPITERMSFSGGDFHTVTVSRPGFKSRTEVIDRTTGEQIKITLKPQSRNVRFVVMPLPGIIKVDGQPISNGEVSQLAYELTFAVDNANNPIPREVTAERPGYMPTKIDVRLGDANALYTLTMRPQQKTVLIRSEPPGAELYLDGKKLGVTPHTIEELPILMDPQSLEWKSHEVKLVMAGYQQATVNISWDNGQPVYVKTLQPVGDADPKGLQLDPPATATPTTQPAPPPVADASPPIPAVNRPSTRAAGPTTLTARPTPTPSPAAPAATSGNTFVAPPLEQTTLLRPRFRAAGGGWIVEYDHLIVAAPKDVAEPRASRPASPAKPILRIPPSNGATFDGLVTSPDGSMAAWVNMSDEGDRPRSRIMLQSLSRGATPTSLTKGDQFDLMPYFWPSGQRILFVSDRPPMIGRPPEKPVKRLLPFDMMIDPPGQPEAVKTGSPDATALCPTLDSAPRPRMYVENRPTNDGPPTLVAIDPGTGRRYDFGQIAAQPRVSPRADSVAFVRADPSTGKRDLWLLDLSAPDKPINLTRTPDVDEWEPAWSKTGSQIAYVSDRAGVGDAGGFSYGRANIWVVRLHSPQEPMQVTSSSAWDDHPAWIGDQMILFRSTRGGAPGVWEIAVP